MSCFLCVFRTSFAKWGVFSSLVVGVLSVSFGKGYAEDTNKVLPPISVSELKKKEKPTPSSVILKGLAAVGSARHDFGAVQQSTELRHDFNLVNEADVPIRIMGMKSVTISVDPFEKEVDETITFEISFFLTTGGKSVQMPCPVSVYCSNKGEKQ